VIEVLFFPSDHKISSTTENAYCHKVSSQQTQNIAAILRQYYNIAAMLLQYFGWVGYQVKPPLYHDNSTSMNHQ